MNKINFIPDLYNNLPDRGRLLEVLDGISNSNHQTISVIPFSSESNVEELFVHPRSSGRRVKKISETSGVKLFELHHISKKGAKFDVSGKFIVLEHPDFSKIYVAFTLEESDFFHKEMRPFFKSYYPEIIFTFIKSKNLRDLIERYKIENAITDIKINRASHLLRFDSERSMSAVTWPKVTLEEAFNWVHENNGWFKSLQFDAKRIDYLISNVFIDRRGFIRANGNFLMAYNSFILPTCISLDSNNKQFSNRDRRSNENSEAKPIVIEYDQQIFEDIERNKLFISALSEMKHSSVSVLHGNPYIHLSIIDYFDGSNFDLWVLSNNEIILVPQMRGTVASIKRVINHIFDTFAEGEVKEYELAYQ